MITTKQRRCVKNAPGIVPSGTLHHVFLPFLPVFEYIFTPREYNTIRVNTTLDGRSPERENERENSKTALGA